MIRNIIEAKSHLSSKKITPDATVESSRESQLVDLTLSKYFFDLQGKIEKEGTASGTGMNYHTYAREMWEGLVGEITQNTQPHFAQFENALISGLHGIDMQEHSYDHVKESLARLVEQYQDSVKHVSLWSTGDVETTAYQIGKILKSKIVHQYHQALKAKLSKEKVKSILKEETSFFVADNKFLDLVEYVKKQLETDPSETVKLVIIEDSRNNFKKAKESLEKSLGEKFSQVEIIPIWASYSREGTQAKDKANSSPDVAETLANNTRDFNAIDDFTQLLDTDRFSHIFKDAHVFVDFDGVIGNNITMRNTQASVTYKALIKSAMISTSMNEVDLVEVMKKKLSSLV